MQDASIERRYQMGLIEKEELVGVDGLMMGILSGFDALPNWTYSIWTKWSPHCLPTSNSSISLIFRK